MKKAPKKRAPRSYLNQRRPPLDEALQAEGRATKGKTTLEEALASLTLKGYFTPRPRPWQLGRSNRGHGRGDFAVLDSFGDLVTGPLEKEDAELIIAAVNAHKP